ncbi:MAG: hypothetical protein ACR2GD_06765 [Pyrinomonadaceae bacterium]
MKKVFSIIILFVCYFPSSNFAQEKPAEKLFEVRGIVKDQNKPENTQ